MTTTNEAEKLAEALRLADALLKAPGAGSVTAYLDDAATELRRLHAENERLSAALAATPATEPVGVVHKRGGEHGAVGVTYLPALYQLAEGAKLYAAPVAATPAAAPVAWMVQSRTGLIRCCLTDEPDAERRALAKIDGDTITPLYLAATSAASDMPAAPLAELQINEMAHNEGDYDSRNRCWSFNGDADCRHNLINFARAIERAHGIGKGKESA